MRVAQNPSAAIGKGRYITDGLHRQIPPIRRELGITNCGAGWSAFQNASATKHAQILTKKKQLRFAKARKQLQILAAAKKL